MISFAIWLGTFSRLECHLHLISGECPDRTGAGLECSDADEVHNDESCDGEENGGSLAHDLEEDLDNLEWLR